MTDGSDKSAPKPATPESHSWLHDAVDNAYTRGAVDFASRHKAGLIAGGLIVAGGVALVATRNEGAFQEASSMIKTALGIGERSLAQDAAVLEKLPKTGIAGAVTDLGAAKDAVGGAALDANVAKLQGVHTYVFDLDRTVVDTGGAFKAYSTTMQNELAKSTGLAPEVIRDAMTETEHGLKSKLFANRLDLIKPVADLYPGQDVNKLFPHIASNAEAAYKNALQPTPEMRELLSTIKGANKQLVLYTGGSPAATIQKLEAAGLQGQFSHVFTTAPHAFEDDATTGLAGASDVGQALRKTIVPLSEKPKSTADSYLQIMEHLNATPQSSLMTGDNLLEDVYRSKKVGMNGAWATWYAKTGQAKVVPDLVLTDPSELTSLVKKTQ